MFQFTRFPSLAGYPGMTQDGFPHSDIPDSNGCTRLVGAFRSVPRPSSALDAKASPVCPYSLLLLVIRRSRYSRWRYLLHRRVFSFLLCASLLRIRLLRCCAFRNASGYFTLAALSGLRIPDADPPLTTNLCLSPLPNHHLYLLSPATHLRRKQPGIPPGC